MKKFVLSTLVASFFFLVLGFGYLAVMDFASHRAMEEIAGSISPPEMEELLKEPDVQALLADNAAIVNEINIKKADLPFTTKKEAIETVMKEFSFFEIKEMTKKIKAGVSAQEKTELYEQLQERLSEEELTALKIIAIKEASN